MRKLCGVMKDLHLTKKPYKGTPTRNAITVIFFRIMTEHEPFFSLLLLKPEL